MELGGPFTLRVQAAQGTRKRDLEGEVREDGVIQEQRPWSGQGG